MREQVSYRSEANIGADRGENSCWLLRQSHRQSCVQTVNGEKVTLRSQAGTFSLLSSATEIAEQEQKMSDNHDNTTDTVSHAERSPTWKTQSTGDSGQRREPLSQRQTDKSHPRVFQLNRRRWCLLGHTEHQQLQREGNSRSQVDRIKRQQ